MSTFDGRLKEFPDIRIDNFRISPNDAVSPLAFFLSHVHVDHLKGLDTCTAPFIYCTAATKQLLLRLETRTNRINFAQGIREHREPTYSHLKRRLRPIPLETPTIIELAPARSIRATLFDANHCTGACVFLIEDDRHAILYTGDIRSEQWWVDSLVRQPLLLPYTAPSSGEPLKRLDCIYLDTTFATSLAPYKCFPTKKDGISELLAAVAKYPADTSFYFNTWTFGYEEVWVALSAFLHSQVHVDDYRYRLYNASKRSGRTNVPERHVDDLSERDQQSPQYRESSQLVPPIHEQFQLIGYDLGNHYVQGCLTKGPARLHSCEYGTKCDIFERDHVRILPIISRYDGIDIPEGGAGGGLSALDEMELNNMMMLQGLVELCQDRLRDSPVVLKHMESWLLSMLEGKESSLLFDPALLHAEAKNSLDDQDDELIPRVVKFVEDKRRAAEQAKAGARKRIEELRPDGLPKRITFPYSRHSSYEELRFVIKAFLPHEIYPCTVEEDWTESDSMERLFSDLYPPGKTFHQDGVIRRVAEQRKLSRRLRLQKSQGSLQQDGELKHKALSSSMPAFQKSEEPVRKSSAARGSSTVRESSPVPESSPAQDSSPAQAAVQGEIVPPDSSSSKSVQNSSAGVVKRALRQEAFHAANGADWFSIELISTSTHSSEIEL